MRLSTTCESRDETTAWLVSERCLFVHPLGDGPLHPQQAGNQVADLVGAPGGPLEEGRSLSLTGWLTRFRC
jgi:hypothetical protein